MNPYSSSKAVLVDSMRWTPPLMSVPTISAHWTVTHRLVACCIIENPINTHDNDYEMSSIIDSLSLFNPGAASLCRFRLDRLRQDGRTVTTMPLLPLFIPAQCEGTGGYDKNISGKNDRLIRR